MALLITTGFLLTASHALPNYAQNVEINVGADLIGAMVTIFLITPLIARADNGRVHEYPRLDYAWYVDCVAGATSAVRILDTFSNLLDGPLTPRFFRAVGLALQREAIVQVLLLDPNSSAVVQRAEELDDPDIRREILRNVRTLMQFRRQIEGVGYSRNFQVRIYNASPSISLYRWDEKALVSFFPLGRLSGQGAQLEVSAQSPLGQFVNDRFNVLWLAARELDELMKLPVALVEPSGVRQRLAVDFVLVDGIKYTGDLRLVAHMARRREAPPAVFCGSDESLPHELIIVDESDTNLSLVLRESFQEKYGEICDVYIHLNPLDNSDSVVIPER